MTEFDPDELIGRMRADTESDWPDRLLEDLAQAPLLSERELLGATSKGNPSRRTLSPREVECLTWLANGLRVDDLARTLGIEPATVKMHLRSARYRLRAKSTTHAIAKAIRQGLIR